MVSVTETSHESNSKTDIKKQSEIIKFLNQKHSLLATLQNNVFWNVVN